jgi:hypothetical protein
VNAFILNLLIGLFGMLCGGVLMVLLFRAQRALRRKELAKEKELLHKRGEVQVYLLLNKKINEILMKREINVNDYIQLDAFDDCFISIDDLVYLRSFAAQNFFYLPTYMMEEFFKNIQVRQMVVPDAAIHQMGGYAYKGGRVVMESFSERLVNLIEDRRNEISELEEALDEPVV